MSTLLEYVLAVATLCIQVLTLSLDPDPDRDPNPNQVRVDPDAPTELERRLGGVSKFRYMRFREEASTSTKLGFRIDGVRLADEVEGTVPTAQALTLTLTLTLTLRNPKSNPNPNPSPSPSPSPSPNHRAHGAGAQAGGRRGDGGGDATRLLPGARPATALLRAAGLG
jgi:hypothetical protein